MATIIAGRFEQQSAVQEAVEELVRAGFSRQQISTFYTTPRGQHAQYPIGGDVDKSPGSEEAGKGYAGGAALGAVAGVAATPVLGPLGPVAGGLVGAHVGGMAGAMSKMKDDGVVGEDGVDAGNAAPVRQAGMMLGVAVGDDHELADQAVRLLRSLGAADIERAEGTIADGDWTDFDPASTPELIHDTPPDQRHSGPAQRI